MPKIIAEGKTFEVATGTNLREALACKVKVLADVHVTKYDGYFGSGEKTVWTPDNEIDVPVPSI